MAKTSKRCQNKQQAHKRTANRKPGLLKGKIWMTDDFNHTSDDVLHDFEASNITTIGARVSFPQAQLLRNDDV